MWKVLEERLAEEHKKTASADGRPAHPLLPIVELMPLQGWYDLSAPIREKR